MANKIITLGGTGLIGSNIQLGDKISSADVNLLDLENTLTYIEKLSPDVIINAAAKTVSSKLLYENPVEYFDENLRMSLNVFKAAAEARVKRLIAYASINAFLKETTLLTSDSYNHYIKQILSEIYFKQYGLNSKVIFLGNIYGPNSNTCNGAIPFIIDKCFQALMDDDDLILQGDGMASREFTYVEDIISSTEQFIHNDDNNPVIMTSGVSYTLRDVVDIVTSHLGFAGKVIWKGTSDSVTSKSFDNKDIDKLIVNDTTLEIGIRKTIDWYLENVS